MLLLANALAFLAACSFTRIFSITSFSSKRIITSLSISSSYAKFSRLFSTNSSSLYLKTTSSSKSSRYLFFIVVCDFLDFNLAYSSYGLDVSFVFSSNKDGSTSNSSFCSSVRFSSSFFSLSSSLSLSCSAFILSFSALSLSASLRFSSRALRFSSWRRSFSRRIASFLSLSFCLSSWRFK